MIRHVAGVGEIVEDVDAAVNFYRDVLGPEVEYDGGGGYATVNVPGVLHYGIWARRAAAESVYGDPDAAERIPLGFSVGFEVDDIAAAESTIGERGWMIVQKRHTEGWGQVTARFLMPGGALGEVSETPWARTMDQSSGH
jgi:catechol 2,3-dioxygenase-like lactoylglutathione lyase family enzyme